MQVVERPLCLCFGAPTKARQMFDGSGHAYHARGAAQALEDAVALGLAMAGSGSVEQALRRYEAVRSRRTRAFIRLGPRIARVTTTSNVAIKAVRSLALRLTPERILALSARGFQRDPHRELRSRPAA